MVLKYKPRTQDKQSVGDTNGERKEKILSDVVKLITCLLYTSDAADETSTV